MELNEEEEKGHPNGKALLANECPLTRGMSFTEQLWPFVVKPGIPRQRKAWVLLQEFPHLPCKMYPLQVVLPLGGQAETL